MFLFIRELAKSRKKSFFSWLICNSSNIFNEILVKFSISEDIFSGILDFSNNLLTSEILFKSSVNFEEYNFVRFSLSLEFSNCLALIKSKVFFSDFGTHCQ